VDVGSGELLALEASYSRSCLNAITFLKKTLSLFRGLWYRWALERLEYRVERFSRCLRGQLYPTIKMSARNHLQGIINLKLPNNQHRRWIKMLIWTLSCL